MQGGLEEAQDSMSYLDGWWQAMGAQEEAQQNPKEAEGVEAELVDTLDVGNLQS